MKYNIDEVIGMAWSDKISFEEIKKKTGLVEKEVISIMRNRPFKIEASDDNISFYEFYKAPIGASGYYYIEYRKKDSLVMNTYCGD